MLKMNVIGHIGQDARTSVHEGEQVANFSVAHSWKNKSGQDNTVWVDCSLWGNHGVVPFLLQGQQVYIEGTPSTRTYLAKDGTTKAVLCVNVAYVQLLGTAPKKEENAAPQQGSTGGQQSTESSTPKGSDDDLPY